jgi:hypothetical protein
LPLAVVIVTRICWRLAGGDAGELRVDDDRQVLAVVAHDVGVAAVLDLLLDRDVVMPRRRRGAGWRRARVGITARPERREHGDNDRGQIEQVAVRSLIPRRLRPALSFGSARMDRSAWVSGSQTRAPSLNRSPKPTASSTSGPARAMARMC